MPRPRIPALYGILQFCLRLTLVVFEVCALAALITLSRYGFDFPIGYVTVSCARQKKRRRLSAPLKQSHSRLTNSSFLYSPSLAQSTPWPKW